MKKKEKSPFADMSFEDFLRYLPMVDWYYDYADDGNAYERGRRQVESYRKLAEDNGPKWVEAFEEEQRKRYTKKEELMAQADDQRKVAERARKQEIKLLNTLIKKAQFRLDELRPKK